VLRGAQSLQYEGHEEELPFSVNLARGVLGRVQASWAEGMEEIQSSAVGLLHELRVFRRSFLRTHLTMVSQK
jgi:hypothetical protein